jgi:UDP-N-acetylglucosamine 1-carboxyvinyltransferase
MIEAGTYMLAAAITKGDIVVKNLIPKHMEAVVAKLHEIGVGVDEYDDSIRVYYKGGYQNIHVKTQPYPGFPTDMHPQFTALMAITEGVGIMTESIFESRFSYTSEFARMGSNIKVEGNTAIRQGVKGYTGAEVTAPDLRAGAALVLAGLAAEGETIINNVENIDRGYEHIEEKLRGVGGDVYRLTDKVVKENYKVI